MDLFEQALARVNSTNAGFRVDNSEELARQREEQRRQNELSRIDRANESAMSNANFIDNRVASLVNEWTPSRNKPQYTKFATKTDAVDANIPQDHPLAGLAGKVKATLQDKLANSQGTGKTFAQLEKEAFDENINSDTMIKAFEYKAKADSSWRNAFNIFGEDKDVKIPDKLQPAYNKWKSGIMEEQKARPELNSDPNAYHYAGGALLGAASGIVAAALAAPATAGTSLAAIPLLTAMATEGALAAGGVYAGKKLQQAYRKSEAGTFHQGNSQDKTIGAILSGALMAAGARNSGAIGLTTMGAVGAGIGAVSPDSAFDLAGWIGTSALVHKAGMYGLKSALEAGKVRDSVRNALSSNADARAVIGEFDKLQSIKAKQAAMTAAEFDAAARKTAAEFDKIREASKSYISTEDALWNDPNWRLSGDRYTNSDTINIINDFNNELRNSSPGGRNVLANSVDTRPKFPMAGRGKKRVAVVPVEEIEKERSNMHFNEFLSEMQSTAEDMRRAEQLKAIAEDENYKDLYENVMYSGSKAEAFDAVSTDGLSRAFGDGPGGNWKMLSLGSRMQIVSAEESASASLFARSVGEVSSADRLNELKKPLIKALRGALNETPEKFGDILRETVEKHSSAYMLDGQLNLNQLQQDLQHYGFDSLHQFAFKLAEESPALMRSQKKLTKLQEASEAIRQMAGMGVTKLGVAAAVGTGAYSFLNNKEAEAGVITPELMEELGKAGTKLWNYSMQRVTPEVADTLLKNAGYLDRTTFLTDEMSATKYEISKLKETLNTAETVQQGKNIRGQIAELTQKLDAITKETTRPDVTLSDMRNYILGNRSDVTWAEEKKILDKLGVDTENGVVSLTGTNSGKMDFGYAESSDGNLVGPGATYSTMGVVEDGIEHVTGGYGGAKSVLEGFNSLEDVAVKSQLPESAKEALFQKTKTAFDELDLHAEDKKAGMKVLKALKNVGYLPEDLIKDYELEKVVNLLKEKDIHIPTSNTTFASGPNTRLNYFKPEKVFDMGEYYDRTAFGLPEAKTEKFKGMGWNIWSDKADQLFTEYTKNNNSNVELNPSRLMNNWLRDQGYDAITHVGGINTGADVFHRVWVPLKDEMVTPFLSIQEQLAQKMDLGKLFAGTAVATAVPTTVIAADQQGDFKGQSVLNTAIDYGKRALEGLGSLLGPKEADAATLEVLAKMSQEAKVSPAVVDYIKESKDPISAVLKKVSDAGLLFKRLPKDAISARGFRASYLQTAPKTENEITKIIAGTQQVFPGQNSLTSPNFGVMTMFNDVKTDDAFIGNIAVQLAHGQSVVADNTRKSLDVVKNIIDRYGIKTSSENSKAITKYMQPVQKEVENVSFPLRAKELALYENKKALEEFKESIGNDPEVLAKSAEELAIREAYNKQLTDEVAKLNEELIPQQNKLTEAYKHLAARYPETRISLACEDTADFQKYPWLQAAIEPHEQKAVLAIKDMMQEYRERITDIMGKKSVISGDFMKHSRYVDPDIIKQMQDLQEEFSRRGLRGEEIIALTKLHSRTKYSMQMIPDVTRNIGEYIPDVETRLMNADLWKVGKPGGWDMVRKSSIVQNSPTLKSMFDRIADSAKPVEETVLRKLSTNYAKLESTRLLFGSLSAPFKHALKLVGDLRTAPVMTIKSMPRALATAGRNFIASKLESLERLGYVEKGYASSVFKNTRALDDFVAGTINQRGMMDYLTDIETRYGAADQSTLNKLFSGVQDATSVGIKAVETFDRSTSVLMAMRMADKKGMTGQQAMYYIYDTILKNNFLSGQLNASWARDPNIRALMLFQNTPFKMWERRIADAVNMKKDIKTAWGIIRNTELPAAYEELQGIGRLMKQAEISFKSGMIRDSLTRDVAGQSTSKLLMREMLLIGGMLALGNKMGINLTGHLLHTPFVKTDEGDVKVSVSPVAQAVVKTAHGVQPAGFPDYTPEDHFAVSNFLRHWYGTSGPLLIGHKMKRLSENDIPDLYKNSKWKFLFSIPASE